MEQQQLPPGFRFSPTDEELLVHYLKKRACGKDYHQGVIAEVDIYKHEPWDLPEKSALASPDPVWYFFNSQDKRHSHSARISRTTSKGYWKATGKDRKICSGPHLVGIKKTLIYYEGRAPGGKRTDWIMHEYKLDEDYEMQNKAVCSAALCRIRRKGGPGPRNGEQFGAPVYNENSDWNEDVDDALDEEVPLPSSRRLDAANSFIPGQANENIEQNEHVDDAVDEGIPLIYPRGLDAIAFFIPDQCKVPKEAVLDETNTQGLSLNDLPHTESVDTSTELDLCKFLEAFLADNPEVASLETDMVSMERTMRGEANITCNVGCGYAPSGVENLVRPEGTAMDDSLHPTPNEEQILADLLHLTDGSQYYTNMTDFSSQAPLGLDGIVDPHSTGVFGNYIEMNDMDSPLDDVVLRSPSCYDIDLQHLPPDLFDEVESFGNSPDLLNTQGLASRRVRLKINPPFSATQRRVSQSEPIHEVQPEVPRSSGLTIQVDGTSTNNDLKTLNAFSGFESNDKIGRPLSESSSGKESLAIITTNFINNIKFHPVSSNAVSFSPSLLSTTDCIMEVRLDCEAGWDTKGGLCASNANTNGSYVQEAGVDCKAGPSSTVASGKVSKLAELLSDDRTRDMGELVSKVKELSLGSRLVELESNLSTAFNDKVFALGKPVAHLIPSKDYLNPYGSLRRGAMASLCHLGLAVLVLFFIFLGIHMLNKYAA